MNKFVIEKLKDEDKPEFTEMFLDYFIYECNKKNDRYSLKKNLVENIILKQCDSGLIFIDIIKDKECLGFIIYQIDKEESDWKERLGSGFIREFYIKEDFRGKGLGSMLLNNAEQNLKTLGAKEVYLTSSEKENVKLFYQKNGYKPEGKTAHNGKEYFDKEL